MQRNFWPIGPLATLGAVAFAPALQVVDAEGKVDHVDIAPADVAQIVAMRPFLDVTHAVLRDQRAEAVAETVERAAADAARRVAAGDDHGVDPLLEEVARHAGLEEDRRSLLGDLEVVVGLVDARVERGAGMIVPEGLLDGG